MKPVGWMQSVKQHPYIALFVITLIFRTATALPVAQAGYMDASYAIHVAENLAQGRGFTEEVLWNYLDDPAGLPHPSNLYWMPLPSILIAPFFVLFGVSFHVAQIPFIFLSSLLPLFAFYLGRQILERDGYAWVAALLTAFSGFYTIYWVIPDNFTPFALSASLCLFTLGRAIRSNSLRYFVAAGVLAALSHLSRADGVLLLGLAPLALLLHKSSRAWRPLVLFSLAFFLGYLVCMSPWLVRDYLAVGTVYPSAGAKTLWLTNYDDLFRFSDDLTPARYLASGIGSILVSKLNAAFLDALVVAFGALQVFLAPFAIAGLWRIRRSIELLPFFVYAALLYLVMVLVFTFPGPRGSMLHSATALLPFLAVGVPPGIDAVVEWVARRRRTWNREQASIVFRSGFVALAVFLSIFLYAQGLFPIFSAPASIPLWNDRDAHYRLISSWLDQNAPVGAVVMVVDPPTFYNLSHRPSVMIPTDDIASIFSAAGKYGARYLVLEFDHPRPLAELYQQTVSVPGLRQVADFRDALGRPAIVYEVMQ